MNLKNKVVLITGASSGIGKAAAFEFAKNKAKVILVARDQKKLDQTRSDLAKYDSEIMTFPCDVSNKESVFKMTDSVLDNFKKLDILVNNAGFAIYQNVSDQSVGDIEQQMSTNYLGMVYCTKSFLPAMISAHSGKIINVASLAASFGVPKIAPYCASKFAMLGFSEALKHELKDSGVDVTVVSPIMVKTNFFDHPSFSEMEYSRFSLESQTVAMQIVKAAESSKLEITVPAIARLAVWSKHTFPFLVNPLVRKSFTKKD
ncbi:MAG: SDR family NAD(P)-dependent oxidoreductase [Nitrosopumilaceae archaeon]|nr:SDR family NAD(P)-dependent oxidoreductase [Nitrosopumilaceae archaeon]NIU01899.1 SDR family NAD(P)-dependent oxidoreductase [Nitrosopumilaceae archaeon]NIU88303.1 SDR family NAD(P)-dependent oxidoreductase [Nitrosopumilaceae archaeon]NIV66595.1 SDR family NAD(P)-dependent oxidoreductase [Nitrosopumilaceae archaeon]NIX62500.1 SDR family NAD(P)-dependent oxidoreductase [Nitrosopumilaceae archaeon]